MSHPLVERLVGLMQLDAVDDNLYRGLSLDVGGRSVFGGQVVAQALAAAGRSVDPAFDAHSLHAYFLLPGDLARPILFTTESVKDGRSFVARRVQALQRGRPILSMIASFHKPESGFEHSHAMPCVPGPDTLAPLDSLMARWIAEAPELPPLVRNVLQRQTPVDFRPVEPWNPLQPSRLPPRQRVWMRVRSPVGDDATLHRCLLAYLSDFNLLATAVRPHPIAWISPETMVASLDHALWFHRPARVDEWLLYDLDSPAAQGARGLSRGMVWDTAGRLVASVAQEGLIRGVDPATAWRRPQPSAELVRIAAGARS